MEGTNFYRVRAVFEDGSELVSALRLANVGLDPGVLTVFPNPARHHVSMYWEKCAGRLTTVTICNSMGQPVLQQEFDSLPDVPVRFELGQLPEGLYWLKVKADNLRDISARFMVGKSE